MQTASSPTKIIDNPLQVKLRGIILKPQKKRQKMDYTDTFFFMTPNRTKPVLGLNQSKSTSDQSGWSKAVNVLPSPPLERDRKKANSELATRLSPASR